MTSAPFAAGDARHPEVSEVSAYAEGILPPEQAAEVRTHLTECTLCEDVLTSLQEIRAALGSLPAPTRMPEDVASRIDAALAAEALLHASEVSRETSDSPAQRPAVTAEDDSPDASEEPADTPSPDTSPRPAVPPQPSGVVAGNRRARRRLVSRETRRAPDRPPRRRDTQGPGARRSRRRPLVLGAAGLAALSLIGGVVAQVLGSTTNETGNDTTAMKQAAQAGQLRERALDLLAQQTSASRSPQAEQAPETHAPFRTEEAPSVPHCVRKGIDRKEPPLAVDEQTFRGTRSYIVVMPHASDPMRVDAYAVDASCTTRKGSAGAVLATGTYLRD